MRRRGTLLLLPPGAPVHETAPGFWRAAADPRPQDRVLKQGGGSLVFENRRLSPPVVVKRYAYRAVRMRLLLGLLGGRAAREFRHLLFLERADVPAVVPVAALERRAGPLLADDVLFTRAVDGGRSAWEEARSADPTTLADLLAEVADLARRMHQAGFLHGTFFLKNLLRPARHDRRLLLADCPLGLRFTRPIWMRPPARYDIASLFSSLRGLLPPPGARERFLDVYRRGWSGRAPPSFGRRWTERGVLGRSSRYAFALACYAQNVARRG